MQFILKIWKDPVWSKVISTGIIVAIGFLFSYFAGWLPSFITYYKSALGWLLQTTSISNWLLILILTPFLVVFYAIILWVKSRGVADDSFQSYKSDTFFGLKWRWSYCYEGQISIDDVLCFCTSCDLQIFPKDVSNYQALPKCEYSCSDCNSSMGVIEGNFDQLRSKIILKVQKNIRNGQWKKKE